MAHDPKLPIGSPINSEHAPATSTEAVAKLADAKPAPEPVDPVAASAALAAFEAELAETPLPYPGATPAPLPLATPLTAPAADKPTAAKPASINPAQPSNKVVATEPNVKPGPLPSVVTFKNVTKSYGDFTAIKDVTFDIPDVPGRGEFVSLLGPSGCGKSTVLRLIAGLQPQFPATSGEVLVGGEPVRGPGPQRGMVFQDYTSFDNRSVLDNVAFGLECRGVGKVERYDQARHWINKVGLSVDSDQYKYPHQLSGGMRQRVAIARTLILQPKVILMDEPFGALDPPTRSRMQDNLVELWREESPTIFFITHSIEEAVFLGDHILVFSNSPGTVLQQLKVPPADRPSIQMQRDPKFQETVFALRDTIEQLESSNRAGD